MNTDQEAQPLPLDGPDANAVELSALRAEVPELRRIRDAAHYWHGPLGCMEDRDCEEYLSGSDGLDDDGSVERCSHIDVRYATFADVYALGRLEDLVEDLLDRARRPEERLNAADVVEAITGAVYSIAGEFDREVRGGEHIVKRDLYRNIVAAELAGLDAELAERRAAP